MLNLILSSAINVSLVSECHTHNVIVFRCSSLCYVYHRRGTTLRRVFSPVWLYIPPMYILQFNHHPLQSTPSNHQSPRITQVPYIITIKPHPTMESTSPTSLYLFRRRESTPSCQPYRICPNGCINRAFSLEGQIVRYFHRPQESHSRRFVPGDPDLSNHCVILLPARYKQAEYRDNEEYYACVVVRSNYPKHLPSTSLQTPLYYL